RRSEPLVWAAALGRKGMLWTWTCWPGAIGFGAVPMILPKLGPGAPGGRGRVPTLWARARGPRGLWRPKTHPLPPRGVAGRRPPPDPMHSDEGLRDDPVLQPSERPLTRRALPFSSKSNRIIAPLSSEAALFARKAAHAFIHQGDRGGCCRRSVGSTAGDSHG